MKRFFNRRRLAVLGVLLGSQLLSACIILPRPYLPRMVVVEPGHSAGPHDGHQDRRGYRR